MARMWSEPKAGAAADPRVPPPSAETSRLATSASAEALAAAEEIMAEARHYSLGDVTIRELIDEGRD